MKINQQFIYPRGVFEQQVEIDESEVETTEAEKGEVDQNLDTMKQISDSIGLRKEKLERLKIALNSERSSILKIYQEAEQKKEYYSESLLIYLKSKSIWIDQEIDKLNTIIEKLNQKHIELKKRMIKAEIRSRSTFSALSAHKRNSI